MSIKIVPLGTLLLIIYIIIDCIRHKTANFSQLPAVAG